MFVFMKRVIKVRAESEMKPKRWMESKVTVFYYYYYYYKASECNELDL